MDADIQAQADQLIQAVLAQKEADIQSAVAAAIAPKDSEIANLQTIINSKDAEAGQKVKDGQNELLVRVKSGLIRN